MVNAAECAYDPKGEFELHEVIPPDGTCEIHDGYCRAGKTLNGQRRPSIVEMIAPFLVPADLDVRAKWGKEEVVPPPGPPTVVQVAAQLEATGLPPAAAELVATGTVEKRRGRPPKANQ